MTMHYIPLVGVCHAELRTDTHFAETSSRLIKAMLKVVKIDIFRHFQPMIATRRKKERDKNILAKVS